MQCQWQSLINILPVWMRDLVDERAKDTLLELRLRINAPPKLITYKGIINLDRPITIDDIQFCINLATKYSPWSTLSVSKGFITAPGGHRIGLCGTVTQSENKTININNLTSICIRIARDIPNIAKRALSLNNSILIIGKPGSGKTTLLRDLIREKSNSISGCITVVDERQEIFPKVNDTFCFPIGNNTDVLSGCNKAIGIEMAIRNMGPKIIAVDEITAEEDCQALVRAGWCGVSLYATAHAGNREELFTRPVYHSILKNNLFHYLLILNADRSFYIERI